VQGGAGVNFDATFTANFQGSDQTFAANFKEVQIVHTDEIPKEYGLITYTQDKTIIVS
jgi:hypothetical protein